MPIITDAQARGSIESQVPPEVFEAQAAALTDAVEAILDQEVGDDMLTAYALLGASREDLVAHIATVALQRHLEARA